MNEKLDPLSDLVRGALETERARAPSAEQVARLAGRLEATFGAATAAAGAAGAAHVAGKTAGVAGGKVTGALLGGKALLFAAGVAIGGAGGATLHAKLAAPRVIEVTRVVEVKVPVPAEPVAEPAVPVQAPAPVVPARAAKPLAQSGLDTERLLIEQATAALGRGEAAQALEACERHAAKFPTGQLVEERESLAIRALVLAGRRAEAERRAAAFRARFPESMLRGVIDAALGE
ncbi:MAG: hypothetical protein IPJ65_22865 [Archangiaceae bacterium]|nr:hypothetical protein [Archangiaceae bacterium]